MKMCLRRCTAWLVVVVFVLVTTTDPTNRVESVLAATPPPQLLLRARQQQQSNAVVMNPDLPLGDINIVVVTDTHSWCGGQKKLYGADGVVAANYGDVLSFVQRLKQYINSADNDNNDDTARDVWFVMNGDFVDGTGLSMNRNVDALLPILERMQYDAINVGNHELYTDHLIQQISSPGGFIEWYGDRYISSNVRFNTTRRLMWSSAPAPQTKAAPPGGLLPSGVSPCRTD